MKTSAVVASFEVDVEVDAGDSGLFLGTSVTEKVNTFTCSPLPKRARETSYPGYPQCPTHEVKLSYGVAFDHSISRDRSQLMIAMINTNPHVRVTMPFPTDHLCFLPRAEVFDSCVHWVMWPYGLSARTGLPEAVVVRVVCSPQKKLGPQHRFDVLLRFKRLSGNTPRLLEFATSGNVLIRNSFVEGVAFPPAFVGRISSHSPSSGIFLQVVDRSISPTIHVPRGHGNTSSGKWTRNKGFCVQIPLEGMIPWLTSGFSKGVPNTHNKNLTVGKTLEFTPKLPYM
jgi:hypothetical protein